MTPTGTCPDCDHHEDDHVAWRDATRRWCTNCDCPREPVPRDTPRHTLTP